jgi:hypothetical protein
MNEGSNFGTGPCGKETGKPEVLFHIKKPSNFRSFSHQTRRITKIFELDGGGHMLVMRVE